jgi:hypothetical protein
MIRITAIRTMFWIICCVFAFSVSPMLCGQTTGSFSGTILDKSGVSISGATVTITSQGTGVALRANIRETPVVLLINEQGEEEKGRDEWHFS